MDKNRKTAYSTLLEIERNQAFSNIELNRQIKEQEPDSPAFVRELVYGVLETKRYLDYVLSQLIPKGLKGVKKQTLTLLRMGLYQILYMDSVPDYAAVSETVKLARRLIPGRDGFVNGVLRGYGKKAESIKMPDRERDSVRYFGIRYSYADWIVKLWISQYGAESAESLLRAGNLRPQLSVRVNLLKTNPDALRERLEEEGFVVTAGKYSRNVLYVRGSGLLASSGYQEGLFSIQDESSALAAECLHPRPGETVIDLCAAPGGKTLAMAELMENRGRLLAFDIYAHKLELLEKEAERLGVTIIETGENDGCILRKDLIESADRVLVDGPCSGLGVVRRKPEIKYKEISDDGRDLAKKQLEILSCAGQYVKPGGMLLYSTCTINKIENAEVATSFLKANRQFELVRSRQLLPDADETDGFYICKMRKKGSPKGDDDGGRV